MKARALTIAAALALVTRPVAAELPPPDATSPPAAALPPAATDPVPAAPRAAAPPPAATLPPAAAPIRSAGLMAGGVVLAVAGGAAVALGLVRVISIETCPGTCHDPKGNETIGGVALGLGAAALAGGVVMAVLGSRRAPAAASRAPAWVGEAGGTGWVWRF
jgi:hypothetical protein